MADLTQDGMYLWCDDIWVKVEDDCIVRAWQYTAATTDDDGDFSDFIYWEASD